MRCPYATFAQLATVLALTSCGAAELPGDANDQSSLSQLTRADYSCKTWNESRVAALKSKMPSTFLKSWQGEPLNRVHQAMSGIPDVYLDWLYAAHKRNGFSIKGENPGFPGGVTELSDREPIDMKVLPEPRIVDLTLQHEIGHALNPFLWNETFGSRGAFESQFNKLADADYANSNLNDYPKSYPRGSDVYRMEFFAEAFNSYYCSESTNKMIQEQFPGTYAFLAKNLAKPVWAAGDATVPSKDISLLLGTENAAPRVWIAAAKEVATARLCLGSVVDCRQSLRSDLELSATNGLDPARAYFAGTTTLAARDGLQVTLLGLDASGKLVAARTVRIDTAN